jgi:hypothetical protein
MSCFCLFGRRRPPSGVPDSLGSSHKAVDGSDDNARTDEHQGGKKSAETDSISPSMSNGHFHEDVPDWVHKEPVHLVPADGNGRTYAEGTVEVKGELGSMNSGAGGFQTRATPRSVFRQAAAQPPSRTSNPHAPQATKSNGDWAQAEPSRHELSGNGPGVYKGAGLGGGTDMLVHDTDALCLPGTEVMVSERWLEVPYFKQFTGLRGKLIRRGLGGATWYAAFPGCEEQAFSTGMHGRYILCYAPVPTRHITLRNDIVSHIPSHIPSHIRIKRI